MSLTSPLILVLGVLVVAALVVATVIASRRRAEALAAAGVATTTKRSRPVGLVLTLVGLTVLAVAAAGPQATIPVARQSGTVILAMDVSNSMGADDVSPTRLQAAQAAAKAFIDAQPDSVEIGVVAFDQGALTTSLPNADHSAAADAVARLGISGGTSLGSAILASITAITGQAVQIPQDGTLPDLGFWPSATIVLFSDGEDTGRGVDAATAATVAENAGVHIDTVGVGTAAGANVTVDGYQLHTALDADTLTGIAQTTGGTYSTAADADGLDSVASALNLRLTVTRQPEPLAGAFIVLALVLLGVGALLTVRRTGRLV